jgi:hypothetical protein
MWFVGMPVLLYGVCQLFKINVDGFAKRIGFDLGLWTEKGPEDAGTPTGNEF